MFLGDAHVARILVKDDKEKGNGDAYEDAEEGEAADAW